MGVKSLWTLLEPAGRPVLLETVEGKSMAIDSSIWIYQFQATMRDKEGRGLVNAHVLGFLRRICKLLFYGIKPVFVFDGGAPPLKRMTIAERKRKKSGAAESHEVIAKKLLAAQLRREALDHAHGPTRGGNKVPRGPVTIGEDTVYLEDLTTSAPPRTPPKRKVETPSPSAKKSKWRDHDPYRLPDVDMDAAIARATRSTAPDPRLATEDELRTFIDMLRPEDLDVNSPAFRELPTEVQYEIIGDLRLKSRQTSHKRLQAMLRKSRSALDFSIAQIQNLKQRNELTQSLLKTTDSIGKANVTIPVRIASERNREYVLMKNEDEIGGWVLGIRDDGTAEKPIVLDDADDHINSDQESDDDMDMEEVDIPQAPTSAAERRNYRREFAIAEARKRGPASAKDRPKDAFATKNSSPKKEPLFFPDVDEADLEYESNGEWEDVEDAELVAVMQAPREEQEATDLRRAIEESRKVSKNGDVDNDVEGSDDDLYVESRLDTALKFAYNTQEAKVSPPIVNRGQPVRAPSPSPASKEPKKLQIADVEEGGDDMEEVAVPFRPTLPSGSQEKKAGVVSKIGSKTALQESNVHLPSMSNEESQKGGARPLEHVRHQRAQTVPSRFPLIAQQGQSKTLEKQRVTRSPPPIGGNSVRPAPSLEEQQETKQSDMPINLHDKGVLHVSDTDLHESERSAEQNESSSSSSNEDGGWSHSGMESKSPETGENAEQQHEEEGWDATEEMNVHEETGEFVRFAAQVRGRDLDSVRREIEDEIQQLRQQRKAAMRDSEDVNQAMVAQIMTMLRLFGIPYITAPMEAEAQCATLVELGLVDGVITDDSDVFLFGARRVYKNMFNQSKTVECFLLTDLARELGLDRGTLIRLAYLLGSDYVMGLPGVGPVVAMELLREFPGDDGLHKFKDWWTKVQSGRDKEEDNPSAFRKRFKKRFKDTYLPNDWPNAAVRDAYYQPVVDTSDERFKWGLPDLDGLRSFFHEELGWNAEKVDELLLPIIHKMNRRSQEAATNRQGTLNTFFSLSEGAGPSTAEPRRREAYASRRLQALVSAHRKAQKEKRKVENVSAKLDESDEEEGQPVKNKRRKVSPREGEESVSTSVIGSTNGSRGKGKGRRGGTSAIRGPRGRGRGGKSQGQEGVVNSDPSVKITTKKRSKAKVKAMNADSGDSDEEFVSKPKTAGPTREMELRKRGPRARPAYHGANGASAEAGDSGNGIEIGDAEKMDEDSDSGSEYQEE